MPWKRATQYKRFNVGEYMQQQRLGSIAIENKTKQGRATAKKLKRLDKRVR
jgi:hypothetical protein